MYEEKMKNITEMDVKVVCCKIVSFENKRQVKFICSLQQQVLSDNNVIKMSRFAVVYVITKHIDILWVLFLFGSRLNPSHFL